VIVSLQTMGTVASFDIPSSQVRESDIDAVKAVFACLEGRFSLYRAESELSIIRRGEKSLTRASEELRAMYEAATEWRNATAGAFTPNRPMV
jgi:thiamine biosynthesis lipoprotein